MSAVARFLMLLRFGLLLQNLGAAGVFSLIRTGRYLLGGPADKKRRPHAPSMLSEAFAVALITYLLVHVIRRVGFTLM